MDLFHDVRSPEPLLSAFLSRCRCYWSLISSPRRCATKQKEAVSLQAGADLPLPTKPWRVWALDEPERLASGDSGRGAGASRRCFPAELEGENVTFNVQLCHSLWL